ncbi:hypothetical protein SADUNF_Sadunf02G0028500 [Salix dunnii]|uniref:Uncharacterized protein n=1 Tax=Salix dunnii TaxID=1413687 RepID=A0A835N5T7_9ROSI|nr:hypothetical protein SADUNF_Sadunf02G0028500 [Salix dunnii]
MRAIKDRRSWRHSMNVIGIFDGIRFPDLKGVNDEDILQLTQIHMMNCIAVTVPLSVTQVVVKEQFQVP